MSDRAGCAVVALLLLALAFFGTAAAHAQPPQSQPPIQVQVVPDAEAERLAAEDLEVQKSLSRAAWWQLGLAAVGTCALIVTLAFTARANWTAAIANTKAAEANALAKEAFEHSRETAALELRAYITVLPGGVRAMKVRKGEPPKFLGHIAVRNVGRVQAKEAMISVQMAISADRDRKDFQLPAKKDANRIGGLPPDLDVPRGAVKSVAYAELAALQAVPKFVFVWGAVWYEDGFGIGRETTFVHRYNVASATGKDGDFAIPADAFRLQEIGNDLT